MCKVTKFFTNSPRFKLLSLLLALFYSSVTAQSINNLEGTFEGTHLEYSEDGSNDTLNYFYKLELSQEDNQVVGQSFIYNEEGYYAVVKLRGVLIDDQFYF